MEDKRKKENKISFEALDILMSRWREGTFSEIMEEINERTKYVTNRTIPITNKQNIAINPPF